ncbi:MAG: hypothetical protein A2075_03435 [Geobacteraceae bacterium GWC2_58_44]|nr:MAG: hypothetical protein A2075_03435 [Geobacteraceae bacterium GWC2_58_44]HBG04451.1 hypothetical protein [Geobacter sp.]
MGLSINASDLKYKYPKVVETRFYPKFQGKNDSEPFNRDDLYDIIPLLEAVMDDLGRDDARTLHFIEDLMNRDLPRCVSCRGEVFSFLSGCTREMLEYR